MNAHDGLPLISSRSALTTALSLGHVVRHPCSIQAREHHSWESIELLVSRELQPGEFIHGAALIPRQQTLSRFEQQCSLAWSSLYKDLRQVRLPLRGG